MYEHAQIPSPIPAWPTLLGGAFSCPSVSRECMCPTREESKWVVSGKPECKILYLHLSSFSWCSVVEVNPEHLLGDVRGRAVRGGTAGSHLAGVSVYVVCKNSTLCSRVQFSEELGKLSLASALWLSFDSMISK